MLRTVATTLGAGVLLFCASCTGEGADQPADWRTLPNVTATADQAVSSSSVRSSESSTPTSNPSTSSTSVPTSETTSSPTSSDISTSTASTPVDVPPTTAETGPWPVDFTAEQIQWTTEAKARWDEYRALHVQAFAAPSEDWADSFKVLSLPPLLETDLRALFSLHENGVVQTGFPVYEWTATDLAAIDRVELVMCLDQTPMAAHYPDGEPIPVDLTRPRILVQGVVVRDENGNTPWMVVEINPTEQAC